MTALGIPDRTRQLPSWDALSDFITHCRRVMSEDDLIRELGGRSLPALRAERFTEYRSARIPVVGLRASEVINAELSVPDTNRKAA